MANEIFRQKSLNKIQSPENLNDYIKVINPSIWIVFIAAFLLLAGAFVWATVGTIEDKVSVTVISQNGTAVCDYNESIKDGMEVVINNLTGHVTSVQPSGITLSFDRDLPDGIYSGHVVLGLISPISFIFN